MEQNNMIDVKLIDGNIVTNQIVRRTMTANESIKELTELKQNIMKLEQQKQQLEKAVEEKQIEKQLEEVAKSLGLLKQLEKDWDSLIKPIYDDLKKECHKDIAIKKAECGYDRISEQKQKMMKINSILAEIALTHDLDMQHPVMMELRQEFNK